MSDYTLSEIVMTARKKLKISQRELSRRTKIDNNTISKIENGQRKKPNIISLIRLSKILNIELVELLYASKYTESEVCEIIGDNLKIEKSNLQNE